MRQETALISPVPVALGMPVLTSWSLGKIGVQLQAEALQQHETVPIKKHSSDAVNPIPPAGKDDHYPQ